jgi:hypothetical protein
VDHDHQLHQRVVDGHLVLVAAGYRRDDEQVGAADRVRIAAVDLAVGEGLEAGVGDVDAEVVGDLRAERLRGATGGDHHPLVVAGRDECPSSEVCVGADGAHPRSFSTRSV